MKLQRNIKKLLMEKSSFKVFNRFDVYINNVLKDNIPMAE